MKKLLILISFLVSFVYSFGQSVVQRSSTANTPLDPNLFTSRSFRPPVFVDTVSANVSPNFGLDSCGKLIYTYNTNTYWYRGCFPTGKRWVELISNSTSTSFITIITDSSINICSFSPVPVCDTFITNLINPIQSVTIINDSTLLVCDVENLCDTLHIPQTNFSGIQARNGLNMNAPTIVELGGNLIKNTTINTRQQRLTISGVTIYDYPFRAVNERIFTTGSGIQSWRSQGGISTQIDYQNAVQLGVNYTSNLYQAPDRPGYMNDKIGYFINVNGTPNGSFSFRTDDPVSKIGGLFIHTKDSSFTDMVTIWGKHPPNPSYQGSITPGNTGFEAYRIAIFHDNRNITVPGYTPLRNDGSTSRALYTDALGNMKIGPINSGSVVNIINDTTINICSFVSNVPSLCDTITINNIGNIQNVRILNDSTIEVCGPSLCDTLIIPQADFNPGVTANNGLRMSSPTNVQLGSPVSSGSPLLFNTYINAGTFQLRIDGNTLITPTFNVTNTGTAIEGSSSAGSAVAGASVSAYGVQATSVTNAALFAWTTNGATAAQIESENSTTNTVLGTLAVERRTSGTAANGIGTSIEFFVEQSSSAHNAITNQLISKWTDATAGTRTSQFIITGVNSAVTADLLTISGSGATQLNKYGVGTFTGTPARGLAVDASGNVIEVSISASGGTYTASNGLTMTANNVVLGGTLTGNTTITLGSNDLTFTGSAGSEITHTADTHIFTGAMRLAALAGSGAGIVAVDNSGNLSWAATGGGGGGGTVTSVAAGYGTTFTTITTTGNIVIDSTKFPDKTRPNVVSGAWNFTAMPVIGALAGSGAGIVAVDNNGLLSWTASGGAGSVNSGTINRLAYYAATGTVVSELAAITATRALVSNASGLPVASTTTTTQVQYLSSATGTTGTASTNIVFSTSPTLVTPILGTPTSVTLTNATGLPLSTGITGVLPVANGGTNASTASITSFNNITGFTASGATGTTSTNLVFSTSPTLITPTLGVATATSINKVTITAPATSAVLTILNGKILTINKTMTFDGTDNQTYSFPTTSATIARTDAANTFTGVQTFNGNVTLNNTLLSGYSVTTNSQSGTTYTILSTDNGDVIDFTNAGAVTVTLPSGLPVGFNCTIRQLGAGQVTISVSGTTLHNYDGNTKTAGQYAVINIIYESSNTYTLAGRTGS